MGIQILRHGDQIDRVEPAAAHQHPLALAEVDGGFVEPLQPGMAVPLGEEEEQPLHLHAGAILQKLLQQSGWIVVVLEQAFQNPADSQFQVEKLRWRLLEVLLDIGQTGARRLAAGKHDKVDTESIKVDLIVRFKRQFLGLPKSPN